MSFKSFKTIKQSKDIEGTIAILCEEDGKYSRFTKSISHLAQEWPHVKIDFVFGWQLAAGRNVALQRAEGDWLWWMDDDHVFDPSLLGKLLAHDVDVVGPLYVQRQLPPIPTSRVIGTDGAGEKRYGIPWGATWSKPPGLYRVDATGTAGMLVRRYVWEKLQFPYFVTGHLRSDLISEDIYFCEQIAKAGFEIYLDTANPMGHIAAAVMMPTYRDGVWYCDLHFHNGFTSIDSLKANESAQSKNNPDGMHE